MKFKVGDKVIITSYHSIYIYKSCIGEVVKTLNNKKKAPFPYKVSFNPKYLTLNNIEESEDVTWLWFSEDQLTSLNDVKLKEILEG